MGRREDCRRREVYEQGKGTGLIGTGIIIVFALFCIDRGQASSELDLIQRQRGFKEELCPTNGAAASLETFAAALGSGNQKETSLVSPANTTRQAYKKLDGSKFWVINFHITEKEEKGKGENRQAAT